MVFTDWCALHFAQREFSSSHRVIHRLQNAWPQPVRTGSLFLLKQIATAC